MATFGKFETTVTPSELGKAFEVNTRVSFVLQGQKETGEITKQLTNSAIIKLDKTAQNNELMIRSNGVVIVSYKQLTEL